MEYLNTFYLELPPINEGCFDSRYILDIKGKKNYVQDLRSVYRSSGVCTGTEECLQELGSVYIS